MTDHYDLAAVKHANERRSVLRIADGGMARAVGIEVWIVVSPAVRPIAAVAQRPLHEDSGRARSLINVMQNHPATNSGPSGDRGRRCRLGNAGSREQRENDPQRHTAYDPARDSMHDGFLRRKRRLYLPFFLRNRSMNPVSIFPARKSSSARIFR
jgi:hypothetical protein